MQPVIALLIGFLPNPRMYKRIDLEKRIGDLHVICWDKGNSMLLPPVEDGYASHIIKQAAGGDPIRRYIPYRKFARKALKLLQELKPDLIHVQGLDMLKIADAYKKMSKKKVSIIYEVADLHRLLIDKQKSPIKKVVRAYLRNEDRRMRNAYDLLIITSMKFYDIYFSKLIDKEKILYFPNVPNLSAFRNYKKKESSENFTVGYIGSVRYKKQMRNLIEAAKRCGVKLLIAGFESEPVEIEPLCKNNPDIEWVGCFDFEEKAAELYGKCDVMYSVYDADMQNVRVALPNKLYEAVYCEMPLIVAKDTYLADVVTEWGVGVSVDHRGFSELTQVLTRLKTDRKWIVEFERRCSEHKSEIDLNVHNNELESRILKMLSL